MAKWIGIALGLLLTGQLQAAPLAEHEAVAQALGRAPSLHGVQARVRAAEKNVASAGGLPPPMIRMTISELTYSEHHQKQPTAWVMVEQPLPLGGQVDAPRTLARTQVAQAQAEEPGQAGEVAYAARVAFGAWRAAAHKLAILKHHLGIAEAIEGVLVRAMAGGRPVSTLRLAQAQADAEGLRAEEAAVQAALPGLKQQLALWMGISADELGEPELALPAAPTQVLDWPRHPALQKVDVARRSLLARAQAEAAAAGWTVTPGLGLMTMDQMPWGLMVSLALRPGDWPDRQRSAAKAAATQGESDALMPMQRDRLQRLQGAVVQAESELRQLELRRESLTHKVIPALRRAVQASLPGLASGAVSVADVVEAEHRLLSFDLQLADLEAQWLQARARRIRLETSDGDGPALSGGGSAMSSGTMAADTGSQMSH